MQSRIISGLLLGVVASLVAIVSRFFSIPSEPLRHVSGAVGATKPMVLRSLATFGPDDSHHQKQRIADRPRLDFLQRTLLPNAANHSGAVLIHALHLWGPDLRFGETPSGKSVRVLDVFLGLQPNPYDPSWKGVFYAESDGLIHAHGANVYPKGEAHFDQAIAELGQLGITLDHPIAGDGLPKSATLRDAFESVLLRFSPGLWQPEWTVMAIAAYLPPASKWTNRWGAQFTLSDLARELFKKNMGDGPCFGGHTLFAMCYLLRVDEQDRVLDDETRQRITEYLLNARERLETNQLPSGVWTPDWASANPTNARDSAKEDLTSDLLLATGHHLEWISVAPPQFRPKKETIQRAVDWCCRTLTALEGSLDLKSLRCPMTHALLSVNRYYFPDLMNKSSLAVGSSVLKPQGRSE
jgi:hypothetical protein